ncbi:unnamed protein product [Jaminaea pallidilutea]
MGEDSRVCWLRSVERPSHVRSRSVCGTAGEGEYSRREQVDSNKETVQGLYIQYSISLPRRRFFKMAQRVTLRRRNPYNTKSNRRRVIKTPGGKLRYLHIQKLPTAPKCGDCHAALPGIKSLRPREYATVSKRHKTVQRAYGGSRCASCVRTRIIRAFLVEEAKIVKQVMKAAAVKK